MTDLRKAAEMALEALEGLVKYDNHGMAYAEQDAEGLSSIAALRQALAQPEQEPVAWLIQYKNKHNIVWGSPPGFQGDGVIGIEPLYTAPPKCEWVGLTHEERDEIDQTCRSQMEALFAIEAKLKEKNT